MGVGVAAETSNRLDTLLERRKLTLENKKRTRKPMERKGGGLPKRKNNNTPSFSFFSLLVPFGLLFIKLSGCLPLYSRVEAV